MTDYSAVVIAGILFAAGAIDMVFNGGAAVFFLTKKLLDLMAFVAFWR